MVIRKMLKNTFCAQEHLLSCTKTVSAWRFFLKVFHPLNDQAVKGKPEEHTLISADLYSCSLFMCIQIVRSSCLTFASSGFRSHSNFFQASEWSSRTFRDRSSCFTGWLLNPYGGRCFHIAGFCWSVGSPDYKCNDRHLMKDWKRQAFKFVQIRIGRKRRKLNSAEVVSWACSNVPPLHPSRLSGLE